MESPAALAAQKLERARSERLPRLQIYHYFLRFHSKQSDHITFHIS